MGEVFLAEDLRLQRKVALKALQSDSDQAGTSRLLHEARAAARLNHPNIAAVHDVIERDGRPFIVMEYVDGQPLSAMADRPLSVAQVVDIGIELADAIAFAHAHGVVHRDIKPANVMISAEGHVKLLDLGLARMSEPSLAPAGGSFDSSTTGMPMAGTPAYMAPEQLLGGGATTASDIYSFGVLLFELLAARRPFEGHDMMSLVMSVASGTVPRLEELRPDVPPALSNLISWAMAREPRDRPASADRLRAELTTIRRQLDRVRTESSPALTAVPHRRHIHVVPAGLLTLAVVGILGWLSSAAIRPPAAPPVVAVLPAINVGGEPDVDEIGAGLMSVIADNLEAAPDLTVVPHAAANAFRSGERDLAKAAHDLGATYLVDVSLQKSSDGITADARVISAGAREPIWTGRLSSDALSVQRALLAGIGDALQRAGAFRRPLSDEQRRRLGAVPTHSPQALQAYSHGRVLLDSVDSVEKLTAALAAFDEAIALDATFALAHAGASEAAGAIFRLTRDEAKLKRAADSAARAVELEPRSGHVQVALADVHRRMRQPVEALRHVEVALRLSPESDDAHRLKGTLLRGERRFEESLASLQRAIALRPGYWLNHHQLGITLIEAQRYDAAARAFQQVTRLRPDYFGGYQALGTALHYSGNVEQAIGNYEHALRLAPSYEARANLGYTYYAAGRLPQALEMYRAALALDPQNPKAHRNLADVLWRMDRRPEARRSYLDAIAIADKELAANPRDIGLIGLVALCEARLARLDPALRHANEALALAPDDVESIYNSAAVNALAGRADKAVEQLKRALDGGYPKQLAREDDYFDPLRNDGRFTRLLAGQHP